MEFVLVIGLPAGSDQLFQLGEGPAVQLQHLLRLHQVVRVKALQVAQAVPGGVPEFQVVLAQLLENLLGAPHIGVVV